MKQNILQTERVYYAIEQMEQISQVLIRKIETNIGMFHVNKLSQGTMGAGWNDVLYNAYCFNLIFERINKMDLDKHSATFLMLAAVVCSTPTTIQFINLVNYGVRSGSFQSLSDKTPRNTANPVSSIITWWIPLSSTFVTIHFFRPPPLLLLSIRPMTWYPYSRLCLVWLI